jgi:hypothetical protein
MSPAAAALTQRPRQPDEADAGVLGNSRLTAATGLLLIALLAIEGATILSIRGLITWHIFIGIALIGPLLLKTGSTLYRFFRYYTGDEAYVRKGPPNIILRVLGPLVIVSSVTVVGTGLGLLAVRPGDGGLLLLAHKASFIVWVAATTIHVLGHLIEAAQESWHELHPMSHDQASRRRTTRVSALVLSLALGLGLAAAITPTATSWTNPHSGSAR